MTTVRPKGRSAPPTPFTDTRTVVIGLLALVASVSVAAAAVFAARAAGSGPALTALIAASALTGSVIANVKILDGLIKKDN